MQTKQTNAKVISKVEAMTQELKVLQDEKNEIAESIELSTQTLASANGEVEKACQMIARGHKSF